MKKVEYKKREFLSPDDASTEIACSRLEHHSMQSPAYHALFSLRSGKDKVHIQRFLIRTEDAEEMMAVLAKIEDHARSLRNEIINLKFDQNKQTNETV